MLNTTRGGGCACSLPWGALGVHLALGHAYIMDLEHDVRDGRAPWADAQPCGGRNDKVAHANCPAPNEARAAGTRVAEWRGALPARRAWVGGWMIRAELRSSCLGVVGII